jgi:serine/threonine-protein kinase RsbT
MYDTMLKGYLYNYWLYEGLNVNDAEFDDDKEGLDLEASHSIHIKSENDIYIALHYVRLLMDNLSFMEMDKQKVLVSVSELTRNILDHSNSVGYFSCGSIEDNGIFIIVEDYGPGISSVKQINTGQEVKNRRGLGLGLAGAKRLMDQFSIKTSKEGTEIVAIKWKN